MCKVILFLFLLYQHFAKFMFLNSLDNQNSSLAPSAVAREILEELNNGHKLPKKVNEKMPGKTSA